MTVLSFSLSLSRGCAAVSRCLYTIKMQLSLNASSYLKKKKHFKKLKQKEKHHVHKIKIKESPKMEYNVKKIKN